MIGLVLSLSLACDLIVRDKRDWQRVNDPELRVICVAPGRHNPPGGVVTLTQDGTAQEPRYLVAFDPDIPDDETHPVALRAGRRAVIPRLVVSASHWVVDRLAIIDSPRSNLVSDGATGNTFDRLLIEGAHRTGLYFKDSSNNVVRRCVMRNPILRPGKDNRHIYVGPGSEFVTVEACEFINGTGSIAIGPGTLGNVLIRDNDMYVTKDRYTDCEGKLNPAGPCSCSEMHIVFKATDRMESQVLIENNRMWGMRRNDSSCASTGSPGHAINLGSSSHRRIRNVTIRDNVIWNNQTNGVFVANFTRTILIEGNVIADSLIGVQNTYGGAEVRNNIFVANEQQYLGSKVGFLGNRLIDLPDDSEQYCFDVRRWTGPERICLPMAYSSAGSGR